MATRNPSSYSMEMFNLLATEFDRQPQSGKDVDYLNVFFEVIMSKEIGDKDACIVKRPGVDIYIPGGSTNIRGMYYSNDFRKLYYVYGNTLAVWNVDTNTSVTVLPGFFASTVGDVGFTDYLYDSGQQSILITDGLLLKQITNAEVVTTCTDPDIPTPHQPYPVFLDGYIFLLKTGTSDLYNSNLNDPLQWTAGDFISSEILPDQALRPAKINNYIIVFGTESIEYFFDAANTTGSPLQRNDTPVKFNGYLGGFAQWGNKIYFVGNNVQGQPDIYILEDLKMDPAGDVTLCRYLANLTNGYGTFKGNIVGIAGHVFYLINAGSWTYVYDLMTKLWARWAFQQQPSFPMTNVVNAKTGTTYYTFFSLFNSDVIYNFSTSVYQDVNVNFTCAGQTRNETFGSYNQKNMSRLIVWADKPNTNSLINVSWTDDDYLSYSTPRPIDLFQERPSTDRLGRFRRRAFKWTYADNQPFRIKGFEVNINKGQH